jgi:hypothetical protein
MIHRYLSSLSTMPSSNIIPEGYIVIVGSDGEKYVVPEFMVPAFHQMFDSYRKKLDIDAFRRAGAVSRPVVVNYYDN